ncbi:MAG: undecaprenyl-phosphate galactose phosphotransferase WbaP [Treponema sp.]|nr:undecaprenyl-phosphate galactose phosphotransferase WbaP [Treponema sp.]
MTIEEFKICFPQKYPRTSSFTSGISLMVIDCFSIMLCIGISFFIINAIDHSFINFKSFVTYSIYLPLILLVFYAANLYPGIMLNPSDEVRHLAIVSCFSLMGIALSITVESDERFAIVIALILACPFAIFILPACREIARHIFAKNSWWGVPAVIYATGNSADFIIDRMKKCPNYGYKPCMIINSKPTTETEYKGIPIFQNSPELIQAIKELGIKVAFLCDYEDDTSGIMACYRYTIYISKTMHFFGNMNIRELGGILGFSITHNLTKPECLLAKRLIDILIIVCASPFVLPVTLIIAILVKLTSKGPVFYGHKRVGKNGKEIKCWKFRSMVTNADQMLEKILAEHPDMRKEWERDRKFTNDPRVTKLGKILRKTSLDELPQLWNILCGEMSFVGPRPVTESELDRYGKYSQFILSVQPGLSGMWQISGRSDTGYEERITLDTYYIQNWSVWIDIWIIIKTFWVVIKGKGAY